MHQEKLYDLLFEYRKKCEAVWCEATASPNLRPIAGKPISTGQCSATSLVIRQALAPLVPPGSIKLALGAVYALPGMQPLIPLHVWLQYYKAPYAEPLILDITADQSVEISETVIFEPASQLLDRGLRYYPKDLPDNLKAGTHKRAELLQQLLGARQKAQK